MKEKTFMVLIIISLFVLNIFILIRFYQFKQQANANNAINSNFANSGKDELHSYMLNFTTSILNSNLQLKSVMIKDSSNIIKPLKDVFKNGQKYILVCRFSKMHCESCVSSSIEKLRVWVDSKRIDNVLFLGNYQNNRIFKRTVPLYGIKEMNVFNSPSLNIPIDELGYPYYFVLDNDMRISNIFVPDKGTPNITYKYLTNIQKRFKINQ